jgi:endonuclease YncB( thermonuclease family)
MQKKPVSISVCARRPKPLFVQWRKTVASALASMALMIGASPAPGGDSLYGKVKAVKSAELVTLDYGSGEYVVRLAGIEAPKDGPAARQAQEFISKLLIGKNVRMRFEMRNKNGEMVSRLFTDDSVEGTKDVGVELLKAGVVKRQKNYDYKYGELAAAENEAQKERRGLWK